MRRIIFPLLALVLLLSACGPKQEQQETAEPAAPPQAESREPEAQPEPDIAPLPEPEPDAEDGRETVTDPEQEPAPEGTAISEPRPDPEPLPEPDPVPQPEPDPVPDGQPVILEDVCAAMVTAADISDPMYLDIDAFTNLYGIDPAWCAQAAGFVTMSGVFPDEVAVFEAVDADGAVKIADCLQKRLDEVMVQAETYDPDSYAKAQQCSVVTNGNYVRLLLSPKQEEMAAAYGQFIS